jgi:large subunit ribosomal protein L6
LRLALGFTHPVEVVAPSGITFRVEKNVVTVLGAEKARVGEVAATIRRFRPPEPYKGKGIRYVGEVVRRKAGKVAGATTTGAG